MARLLERVFGLKLRYQFLIAALIGAVGAFGQAPWGLWPATVVSLGVVFGLIQNAETLKRAGQLGWAAGTGYFMVALFWIVEPFFVDAARHGWMAPFALFGLAFGLAIFWAVTGAITRGCGGRAGAFVTMFVLVEAVRTYLLTGFPWAQLGHVFIDTGALGWAPWAGSLGLTGLIVLMAVALWLCVSGRIIAGPVLVGVSGLLFGFGSLFGFGTAALVNSFPTTDAPLIRLIQPNAAQHEKWDPEMIPVFFNRQINFTAAPPKGDRAPDLIVWPETAVAGALEYSEPTLRYIAEAASGTPVVLGIQRIDDLRYYNSLIQLDPTGGVAAMYDKHHLVPFGEYMPLGDLMARFGIHGMAAKQGGGYSAGPGPQTIDMGALGRALPLICYEAVFPHDVGGYDTRPDFLLLITNDAWFGEASGPYQHLAQARLRSAEQGLPMIRVANTGVSAMIDGVGRVTHSLPLGQSGWIDAPLPPPLPATLYSRTGDWPAILAALALLILSFAYNVRKPRDS